MYNACYMVPDTRPKFNRDLAPVDTQTLPGGGWIRSDASEVFVRDRSLGILNEFEDLKPLDVRTGTVFDHTTVPLVVVLGTTIESLQLLGDFEVDVP